MTNPSEFARRLSDVRRADSRTVSRLRRDLEAIDSADGEEARARAQLAAAAMDRGPDLPLIYDFLRMCDEWFTQRLQGSSAGSSPGDAAAAKVQAMIDRWRRVVRAQ
jgi:hypothetical protein